MSNYKYIEIQKKEIPRYLNDNAFWNSLPLPISQQRLYAQYHNSSADDDDILLIATYKDEKLIGYIGAYPDFIYVNKKKEKIAWLSTWWVDPSESGIGWILMKKVYKTYNKKIGVSSLTQDAKKVFDISGYFTNFQTMIGVKAYMRFNLLPVIPEANIAKKVMFTLAKSVINPIQSIILLGTKRKIKRKLKDISIKYCNYMDDSTMRLVQSLQGDDLLKRDQTFFNCLKSYNWLVNSPMPDIDAVASVYKFSSVVKNFNYYYLKVMNESSEVVGFIALSKRDHELKVLYVYAKSEYTDIMVDIIVLQSIELKSTFVKSFELDINKKLKSYKGAWLFKRKIKRDFIISKSFNIVDSTKYKLHTGDGDYCFT